MSRSFCGRIAATDKHGDIDCTKALSDRLPVENQDLIFRTRLSQKKVVATQVPVDKRVGSLGNRRIKLLAVC